MFIEHTPPFQYFYAVANLSYEKVNRASIVIDTGPVRSLAYGQSVQKSVGTILKVLLGSCRQAEYSIPLSFVAITGVSPFSDMAFLAGNGDGRWTGIQRSSLLPPAPKKRGGGLETLSKPPRIREMPICARKLTCLVTVSPIGTGRAFSRFDFVLWLLNQPN